jgi:hypothetical protein
MAGRVVDLGVPGASRILIGGRLAREARFGNGRRFGPGRFEIARPRAVGTGLLAAGAAPVRAR